MTLNLEIGYVSERDRVFFVEPDMDYEAVAGDSFWVTTTPPWFCLASSCCSWRDSPILIVMPLMETRYCCLSSDVLNS